MTDAEIIAEVRKIVDEAEADLQKYWDYLESIGPGNLKGHAKPEGSG